jgi:hypothetical protein
MSIKICEGNFTIKVQYVIRKVYYQNGLIVSKGMSCEISLTLSQLVLP